MKNGGWDPIQPCESIRFPDPVGEKCHGKAPLMGDCAALRVKVTRAYIDTKAVLPLAL